MEPHACPDVHALRGVLLELAGYEGLRVTIALREDGRTDELRGSPVQLLIRLEEYTDAVVTLAFSFPTWD